MKAKTFWLTGFSGAGKTTLSIAVKEMINPVIPLYLLDGDILRETVCAGLGFSKVDRKENLRRAAGVCKILNDAGLNVLAAFVSPYQDDRDMIRNTVGVDQFYEIYVDTSIVACELRDPKGLYRKARANQIPMFTGISDPYEVPVKPSFTVHTEGYTIHDSAKTLCEFLTGEVTKVR